jgi:polysaccharide biosynthesis/export protein
VTRFKFLAVLALCVILPAMGGQQTATEPQTLPEFSVGLAPGDQLDVRYVDFPEINSLHVVVTTSGTIYVPYVGQVKVVGMMPEEAEQAIRDALQAKEVVKSPQVMLTVASARNLAAIVLGAVTEPHPVPLYSPAPLSYVLSQIGPITAFASYHVMVAHRDGSPPNDVELDRTGINIKALGTMVSPGDIVSVVTAGSFFALGEFNHPGIFPIVGTQHMTLMQAVSVAGGPDTNAALSRMRILRNVDGHREEIIVDLAKLHDGKVADPLIQTDDIVFLPKSNVRVVLNSWLNQSLYALTAINVIRQY